PWRIRVQRLRDSDAGGARLRSGAIRLPVAHRRAAAADAGAERGVGSADSGRHRHIAGFSPSGALRVARIPRLLLSSLGTSRAPAAYGEERTPGIEMPR